MDWRRRWQFTAITNHPLHPPAVEDEHHRRNGASPCHTATCNRLQKLLASYCYLYPAISVHRIEIRHLAGYGAIQHELPAAWFRKCPDSGASFTIRGTVGMGKRATLENGSDPISTVRSISRSKPSERPPPPQPTNLRTRHHRRSAISCPRMHVRHLPLARTRHP
jgi:hypothetical protein